MDLMIPKKDVKEKKTTSLLPKKEVPVIKVRRVDRKKMRIKNGVRQKQREMACASVEQLAKTTVKLA